MRPIVSSALFVIECMERKERERSRYIYIYMDKCDARRSGKGGVSLCEVLE